MKIQTRTRLKRTLYYDEAQHAMLAKKGNVGGNPETLFVCKRTVTQLSTRQKVIATCMQVGLTVVVIKQTNTVYTSLST